jgi:hypothetical protein
MHIMLRMIASTIGDVLFQATYKKADRQAAVRGDRQPATTTISWFVE